MAIDLSLSPEEQEQEPTGFALERPEHNDDPEVDDENGFEEIEDAEALIDALHEDVDEEAGD